ncbi:hypothetical protein [Tropicimonas marinistellae]|uniref:hypothetical protein n=1 Tax=Tropicimonas marinistellae TaxID=1739787 RepID=UPI001F3F5743|nr:hypothetical protein [Tropicimonas marinistellae]
MTKDAIVVAILDHWNRQCPNEVAEAGPKEVQETAAATAELAELEMEVLMAEHLMNREMAWSEASRIFLAQKPVFED